MMQAAESISINGFYFPYQATEIETGQILMVPHNVSRMPQKAWRVYLAHADGEEQRYVFDSQDGPEQSLARAESMLMSMADQFVSPWTQDQRSRRPGPKRKLNTGVTGVVLSRALNQGSKRLTVLARGQVNGLHTTKTENVSTGVFPYDEFQAAPNRENERLARAFRDAVAWRRAYLDYRASHGYPDEMPPPEPRHYENMPDLALTLGDAFEVE